MGLSNSWLGQRLPRARVCGRQHVATPAETAVEPSGLKTLVPITAEPAVTLVMVIREASMLSRVA